jgi:hypothetical protein
MFSSFVSSQGWFVEPMDLSRKKLRGGAPDSEVLSDRNPGRYDAGQLRTLRRRVVACRRAQVPDRDLMFEQVWRPAEYVQSSISHTSELTHKTKNRFSTSSDFVSRKIVRILFDSSASS